MKQKRIALVVQRFGEEINGGSELYARQIAGKLSELYNVEVLTTCAADYYTWENRYPEGIQQVNGLRVRRFKVDRKRDKAQFDKLSARVYNSKTSSIKDQMEWMELQGPVSSGLFEYIKRNRKRYDCFVFMTYLYYTTFTGLQQVPEKSLLISTAHDEPPIYLDIFYPFFHLPKAMIYLTEEEKQFVNRKFNNGYKRSDVVGIGIDLPEQINGEDFRKKYNIIGNFIVYVGRLDESKGLKELFDYFLRYKKEHASDLKLVLMGKAAMEIPKHQDILPLGFVSDEDKYNGMAAARLLMLPSRFESLSMSVLESMALGVPVLVNAKSEVLKGHCIRSNGGLYYNSYHEFAGCMDYLDANHDTYLKMKQNCVNYVNQHYTWDRVMAKYKSLIDQAIEEIQS
jgi:glycosyltransferase involved in cell wall biosynthesis